MTTGRASGKMPAVLPLARRFTSTLAAVTLGLWAVFALDGVTIRARGGHADALAWLHWASVVLGAAAAAVAWAGAELVALPLRIARRSSPRIPPPSTGPAVAAGIGVVIAMAPGHAALARHVLGSWLTSLYAVFPVVGGLLLVDLVRRRASRPTQLVAALALGALGALAHWTNANLFTGLYPPLHQSLAVVTAVALIAAATLLLARGSLRLHLAVIGALAATALAAALWPTEQIGARSAIIFHGTESTQAMAAARPWLDGDGDGIPTGFAGADCDDGDPAVHPLMFEVPGNGRDDNCRLGDRTPDAPPPIAIERAAPTSAGAAAWRAAHPTPDVVLIFIDTLRADAVDALRPPGESTGSTPQIDRFAARAAVFEQARTTAPRTPHAWMSLIRGRFLGRTLACRARLRDPRKDTLMHTLQGAGYTTRARLIGRSWRRFRLTGGWDTLREAGHVNQITGPSITRDALELLRDTDEPLFLVAHYGDPHAPYRDHAKFPAASDSLVDRYRAEVRATDHEVGRVLRAIEARGRPTIVALFSDHGENLGDHGQKGGHHGVSVYDEVVRVPLMIAGPGIEPRRISDTVSIVDLAPTLLDLVGADGLPDADGRSLAGHLFGEPQPPAPTVSEFYDFGLTLRAIVDGRYKLIRDVRLGSVQLFDLATDPGELVDIAGREPDVTKRLGEWLDTWVEYRVDPIERDPSKCKNLVPRDPDDEDDDEDDD